MAMKMVWIPCQQLWVSAVLSALSYNISFIKTYSSLITEDSVLLSGRLFGFNSSISTAFCMVKAAHFHLIPALYKQVYDLDVVFVVL